PAPSGAKRNLQAQRATTKPRAAPLASAATGAPLQPRLKRVGEEPHKPPHVGFDTCAQMRLVDGSHWERGRLMISAGARPMPKSAPIVRIGESMCVKNFL